ncbi:MAG: hypothetical protein PHQ81_06400 [Methanofollis sp.]|nr:hypothetical protein [Methanofollis sp.]
MMKKIISVAIVMCMVLVAVPVLSAASPDEAEMTPKTSLYLNPANEAVQITMEDAKKSAELNIPDTEITKITGGLIDDQVFGKIWQFSAITENGENLLVGVDAKTGELDFYYGKAKEKTEKMDDITANEAKKIAADYIATQNIDGEILFDDVRLQPPHAKDRAGKYSVHFWRVINGIPCLSDGIRVGINPYTGDIMSYHRTWVMPENKVSGSAMPGVQNIEAQRILSDLMKERYETEITIVSSKLVWMDMNYPARIEDCHDIRLTWWIRFDDSYLQENGVDFGSAWIDAHSGEILKKAYIV